MVLAVFNPFCCCTAGVFAEKTSEVASAAPGCCQAQTSELPLSGHSNDQHNPEQCPHQALKDYKASIDKDTSIAPHAVSLPPALYSVYGDVIFEPFVKTSLDVDYAAISNAPPRLLVQMYCVYRI